MKILFVKRYLIKNTTTLNCNLVFNIQITIFNRKINGEVIFHDEKIVCEEVFD